MDGWMEGRMDIGYGGIDRLPPRTAHYSPPFLIIKRRPWIFYLEGARSFLPTWDLAPVHTCIHRNTTFFLRERERER